MITQSILSKQDNCLKVAIEEETATYLRIFTAEDRLLREVRSRNLQTYYHLAEPGTYKFETDGQIEGILSTKFERSQNRQVEVVNIQADGRLDYIINGLPSSKKIQEEIKAGRLSLSELKEGMIRYYEKEALQKRKTILPDEELFKASLGVYEGDKVTGIKQTFLQFEEILEQIKAKLQKARTLANLLKVKADFPSSVQGAVKPTRARKKG